MQTFITIVEQGSMTAAARVLATSLPVMVRTLAQLESGLGVRLINRTTRRLALTEEGSAYLASCRDILGALAAAEARLHDKQTDPTGTLTVTASVLFGQMHVAPVVRRYLASHPQMQVRLLLLDRVVNLLEEGIDVGIRIGPLEDSSLVARPLGQVARVVVASPDFLAQHGVPATPDDLVAFNCIRFTGNGRSNWPFWQRGRMVNVAVQGNFECNHGLPAVEACVAGLGIGQFLHYQVASEIAAGRLSTVLDEYATPSQPVHVVYPHAGLLPARIRSFVDWMRAELAPQLVSPP
ncbi:LysR family transcriptional regulator [Chitinibacteraceae bacterium HSL-7]